MNAKFVVVIALRITGVLSFFYGMQQSVILMPFLTQGIDFVDGTPLLGVVGYFLAIGVPMILGVILWSFPEKIARIISPLPLEGEASTPTKNDLGIMLLVILGIFLTAQALPDLFYYAVRIHIARNQRTMEVDAFDVAGLIAGLLQIVLGILLVFGNRAIASGLRKIRRWPN